jgi:hypothetical protein
MLLRCYGREMTGTRRGGLCRFAIAANIFLIPVDVAAAGFSASIVILSIPIFALVLAADTR